MDKNDKNLKKRGKPLIIALGFTFVILGGLLGFIIGFSMTGKEYDKRTRIIGWIMFICGFISVKVYHQILFK